MKNKIYLILYFVIVTSLGACFQQQHKKNATSQANVTTPVILINEQMMLAGIKTCRLKKQVIFDCIECNGSIEADPNQKAMVCAPSRGYLKKILVHLGDYVNKGDMMAILEHPEYILLQQEYLETKSQYDYYKEDFTRQGELTLENATSLKIMQQAQNEFHKTEAHLVALKKQLALLGIEADSLQIENMISEIALISPMSGYVTSINGQIGMLCTEELPVVNVVGTRNPNLLLKTDEKFAPRIATGQFVNFSLIQKPDRNYIAKIRIASQLADENNMIHIRADILDTSEDLMPGSYVNACIQINADSVYALPNEAIISIEEKQYIFRKTDSLLFELVEIQTGRKTDDISEIEDPTSDLLTSEIIISGAGYLFSESNKEK